MKEQTQRQKVLALLRQMGSVGVNSHDLTYMYSIKQAPTRISELKKLGFNIVSRNVKSNRSVQYILVGEISTPKTITPPVKQPWDEELIRVEKNGRVFWERAEDLKPTQEALF